MKNPITPIAYITSTSTTDAESEYTPSVPKTRIPEYSSGRGMSSKLGSIAPSITSPVIIS